MDPAVPCGGEYRPPDGLRGRGLSHVDLIPLDLHALETAQCAGKAPDAPADAGASFFRGKNSVRREKAKAVHAGAAFSGLDAPGVGDAKAEHLETAADPEDHAARPPQPVNGSRHAGLLQPQKVLDRVLGARQDDHVRISEGARPRNIAQVRLRDPRKDIEIGEIGQVREPDDRDLHGFSRGRAVRLLQLGGERILIVQVELHVGHHADHRNAAPLLEHADAGVQDRFVTAELVDDKALQKGLFVGFQQHLRAQKLREDTAAVDVARQKDRRPDRLREPHVDDIIAL